MKHIAYDKLRSNKSRGLSSVSIILIVMMISVSSNVGHAQSYKQNTGYLLQKVEPLTHYFFIPFKQGVTLPYFYGYYIVNDETLQEFFRQDSVIFDQAILLCDPANEMFTDSAIVNDVKCHTRIKDILLLDDSEIYRIGKGMYIIRKIRYAYYDNTQVKVYIRSAAAYIWDDIQDEDMEEYNAIYEVGELYERDYYQCYHHLVEILPTPQHISGYRWRWLYQLVEEQNDK